MVRRASMPPLPYPSSSDIELRCARGAAMSGARRPPAAEGLAVPSRSLTLALLILGTVTRGAVAVASGRWPQPGGEQPLEPALLLDAGHLREVQAMVSEGRADDARRFGQVAAALAEDIHDIDGLLSAGNVVA